MPAVKLPPTYNHRTVLVTRALVGSYDWGDKALRIPDLHAKGIKGLGVTIGIIDTGKGTHPDLGKYKEAWSVVDRDGIDRAGHGSHVASIIRRAAPEAELISVKALGDDGSGDTGGIAKAIDRCVDSGCHIINMSLGGGDDSRVRAAILRGVKKGALFHCAAGNSGGPLDYPGALEDVAAVGSCNSAGEISVFSSRGIEIDCACPGEQILGCGVGSGFVRMDGTSMASPLHAAMSALRLCYQQMAIALGKIVKQMVKDMPSLLAHIEKHSLDQGDKGRDTSWGWGTPTISFVLDGIEDPPPSELTKPSFELGAFKFFMPAIAGNRVGIDW